MAAWKGVWISGPEFWAIFVLVMGLVVCAAAHAIRSMPKHPPSNVTALRVSGRVQYFECPECDGCETISDRGVSTNHYGYCSRARVSAGLRRRHVR